ncbi:uncharacterized protein LODBEIA_P41130 [Lodderomyces beijingensis]|uniref:Golgi apparatus membrane protein TVP38 n=1 Tax=Lodderomyces beijingensis TaxID=1775926 RepID=A0ABP0ZPP7_9ASCO
MPPQIQDEGHDNRPYNGHSHGQGRGHIQGRGPTTSTVSNVKYLLVEKFHLAKQWYFAQSVAIRILIAVGFVMLGVMGILFLIFHAYLIHLLILFSDKLRDSRYGSLVLFTLIFVISFPPMIGFTALSLLTGMVYGFPYGWPLLAIACVSGSTASFIVFRYLLRNQAMRFINHNEIFQAFAEILSDDSSLVLLILIRLCPTPYSLSNGALAGIPELPLLTYFLATVITSPKLLIHLYIGSKLQEIGQGESSNMTKVVDVISIIVTGSAASLATYLIYARMQAKLASFRQRGMVTDDVLVFGNFEDELEMESHNEIDINSADFDTDNFMIEDDDDDVSTRNESAPDSRDEVDVAKDLV